MTPSSIDRKYPQPPLPLLVTGIAGVAGYNAFHYFHRLYEGQVVGIRNKNNFRLCGPGIVGVDMENYDALAELFREYRFQTVLDCAGNCALKACELDSKLARMMNVDSALNVLKLARQYGARLVHLSCDLVYAGRDGGGYTEDIPPDPVTMYGRTIAEAERLILPTDVGAAVLRISLPMDVSFNGHAGAIDWIANRFRNDRPATLYYDEVRTPTYCDCMNEVFHELLLNDTAGLFHAGGPRRLSLYQIAQIINRVGGFDPDLLHGCPRIEAGPVPPRAGNVTMDSSKLATALGREPFVPWPLDDRLIPTDREWHKIRPKEEPRGEPAIHSLLCKRPAGM